MPKTEPTDPSSQNADDDDDDDDSSDDSDDLDGKLKNEGQDDAGEEEEPLNSGDDVTDDEAVSWILSSLFGFKLSKITS